MQAVGAEEAAGAREQIARADAALEEAAKADWGKAREVDAASLRAFPLRSARAAVAQRHRVG